MGTIGSQVLPTSERQVRPLVPREPEQQRLAWQQAVEQAGGNNSRLIFGSVHHNAIQSGAMSLFLHFY